MPYGTVNADLMTTSDGISSAGLYGFKNRLINGDMDISQRGTSFASVGLSALTYTLDRWSVGCTGANIAVAQVAGIGGFTNALQLTGAASNTQAYVGQRIESNNIADCASTTVTLSAVIQASTAQTVLWYAQTPTAKDNYTSLNVVASGTFSVTTSAQTFSAQISLPASAANGFWIAFYPQNGGAFTSGTVTITGTQLEKGSTATSFDYRPYGTEFALSQRYYTRFSKSLGIAGTVTNPYGTIQFPVTMRSAPTLDASGNSFAVSGGNAGTVAVYNITGAAITADGAYFYNSANNWTVGSGVQLTAGLSAEL